MLTAANQRRRLIGPLNKRLVYLRQHPPPTPIHVSILVSTRRVVIPGLVARRALIAIAIAIAHGKVADRLAGLQRLLSIVALTRAHLAVRPHHNPAAVETVVAHLVRGHDVLTLASALQLLLLLEVELGIRGG